jgi:hypothetical protein
MRVRKETTRMHRLRTEYRLLCEATDEPCWLCGGRIDYLLRDGDDGFELDHYYPVSLYPDLQEDAAGFRPSHRSCNRHRGNRAPTPRLGNTSRPWL